jgi:hypothetical protein
LADSSNLESFWILPKSTIYGIVEKPHETTIPYYGWMPHNAGFGFLDRPRGVLGQIHF